ncbi:hypothetical protein CKJ66_28415 [Mycobacterium avium]|uniref:Uncharacterized protein n=1 Tax=Mycobacterium avium TaxID=1764 RepID=A0A2A2ZAI0_MYCAV|nr:hypothetical protein CKJ66_28415 [Mycobacterium avium]
MCNLACNRFDLFPVRRYPREIVVPESAFGGKEHDAGAIHSICQCHCGIRQFDLGWAYFLEVIGHEVGDLECSAKSWSARRLRPRAREQVEACKVS